MKSCVVTKEIIGTQNNENETNKVAKLLTEFRVLVEFEPGKNCRVNGTVQQNGNEWQHPDSKRATVSGRIRTRGRRKQRPRTVSACVAAQNT